MLFDSFPFYLFLASVFLVYWALSLKNQNRLLLVASYFFYAYWDWRFLGLIVFSSLVDFSVGKALSTAKADSKRRQLLGFSLFANLGLLGVFKYFNFFLDSLTGAFVSLGISVSAPTLEFVLPVGISFYTFQTLSYTIDIYKGKLKPTNDLISFLTFVSFFPQLVAGPIERAGKLLPQFQKPRRFNIELANRGLRHIIFGLFLKKVVANNLASRVDLVYNDSANQSAWACWMATYQFAFQIYGDFAGYSHIAIGSAALLGFVLSRNFQYPYLSSSIREFWGRWHISLSTWFRDYVYIPLGGNRVSPLRAKVNLIATFLVSGLWHGAAWKFLAWGLIHGVLASIQTKKTETQSEISQVIGRFVTFHWVCLAWVFFRATDVTEALAMSRLMTWGLLTEMFHGPAASLSHFHSTFTNFSNAYAMLLMVSVILIDGLRDRFKDPLSSASLSPAAHWSLCLGFLLIVFLLGFVGTVPFIYFQF